MILFRLIIFSQLIFMCCNEKKMSREEVDHIGQAQYERNNALMVELDLYLSHAQKCKTEYEVEAYSDSLPLFRQTQIQLYGGEEHWKEQLAWLKENGAKEISFTQAMKGELPRPIFRRSQKSPWGH